MKTTIAAAALFMMSFAFISCGQSAEEMRADSIKKDSIAHAMNDDAQHMIDSMNAMMHTPADTTKKDSAK